MGKRKGGDTVMSFRQSWFKTLAVGGAAVTLMVGSLPACKGKDDVGSVASSATPPEMNVAPAEIDKITIKDRVAPELVFEKREGSWTITSPPPPGPANPEKVQALLQNLAETKFKEQISASATAEVLTEYELTPDKAVHVVVAHGGTVAGDLWIGKSGGRGQMVRSGTSKSVWAASGMSSYLYSQQLLAWRGVSPSPESVAGRPAGEVLKEHPELLEFAPDDLIQRLAAHAAGDATQASCPALKNITSGDEFERREAVAKATAACKPENDRGLEFVKTCPVFGRVHVNIAAYNFEKHVYPLSARDSRSAQITKTGKALVHSGAALVLWPGVQRMFDRSSGGVSVDTFCNTRGPVNDAVAAVTGIGLDLSMSESEAKTLRDKIKLAKEDDPNVQDNEGVVEVALRLDGKASREELACGVSTQNALTGKVVAWRLSVGNDPSMPLTDWASTGNFEYSPSCSSAHEIFYPKASGGKASPSTSDGGGAEESCVCGLNTPWRQFSDWANTVSNVVPDSSNVSVLRDRIARARSRFEKSLFLPSDQRGGCKGDHGAKAKMMPFVARSRQSLKSLADLLEKPEPDVAKVKAAIKSLESLYTSLVTGPLLCNDEGIHSGQCQFGCR